MIVLSNVTKKFGKAAALSGVTLRIEPGECACICGGNGAGKSVLLHLLIGAETATSGIVTVDGASLRALPAPLLQLYRRKVGMMFQDRKLLPHRTAAENLAFPLEACGASDTLIRHRVPALLSYLGMREKSGAFPGDLSPFEQAKLAFARAVAGKPVILLADEPTAGLNTAETSAMLSLIREMHAAGVTVIVASREAAAGAALGARIITLERGRLIADTNPRETAASAALPAETSSPKKEPEDEPRQQGRRAVPVRKVHITSIGAL